MRLSQKKKVLLGRKATNENVLQREIVAYLNERSGLGCRVSRIKNMGTYDPMAKIWRKNGTEKGIPDIVGCSKDGRAIFIEVKLIGSCEPSKISKEQKEYLLEMEKLGAIVGIAVNIGDAFDIIARDPEKYPRHLRTYNYKPTNERPKEKRKPKDPLAFLASFREEEPTEGADNGQSATKGTEPEQESF